MSRDLSLGQKDLAAPSGGSGAATAPWSTFLRLPLDAIDAFLDLLWAHRMALSFAFCLALFVLLIASVSQTQDAQLQARQAEAEASRVTALHEFIGQMMGASHLGVLDEHYRSALTRRLDAHTPLIASRFPGDVDAQLQLLGIAANVHLALRDRPRYSALRLRQASLLASAPQGVRPEFIASLLADAEHPGVLASAGLSAAFLHQADVLLREAGLDQSRLRATWFALTGNIARDRGNSEQAFAAWEQAEALYAKLGVFDARRFATLVGLGTTLAPWRPVEAQEHFKLAAQMAEGLVNRPSEILVRQVYPALADLQERSGDIPAAIRTLEIGKDMSGRSSNEPLALSYALSLHRLGKPQDWLHIVSVTDKRLLAQRGLDIAEAMLAAGHVDAVERLIDTRQVPGVTGGNEADLVRFRLLMMRVQQGLSKGWLAARTAAELEQGLESGTIPTVWQAPVRRAIAELNVVLDRHRLAQGPLRTVIATANGQVSTEVLLARRSLSELAIASGNIDEALQMTTAAVLDYQGFSAPHDRRVGPALWMQHARALVAAEDPASARLWFERARSGYQTLLPEPAAANAIERIDQWLASGPSPYEP